MTSNGTANFQGDCGECTKGYYSATSQGGMQPDQSATVNGNSPQNCVVANDSATVYAIELQKIAGFYDYQVRVDAQGPSGLGGSMYLAFEDQSGDTYYLSIYSSKRQWHEVSYNSSQPAIVKIFWSDYSFSASSDASRPKAEYQVVSPALAAEGSGADAKVREAEPAE